MPYPRRDSPPGDMIDRQGDALPFVGLGPRTNAGTNRGIRRVANRQTTRDDDAPPGMLEAIRFANDEGGGLFPAGSFKDAPPTGSHHDVLSVKRIIDRTNIGCLRSGKCQQAHRPFAKQPHTGFGRNLIEALFDGQIRCRDRPIGPSPFPSRFESIRRHTRPLARLVLLGENEADEVALSENSGQALLFHDHETADFSMGHDLRSIDERRIR